MWQRYFFLQTNIGNTRSSNRRWGFFRRCPQRSVAMACTQLTLSKSRTTYCEFTFDVVQSKCRIPQFMDKCHLHIEIGKIYIFLMNKRSFRKRSYARAVYFSKNCYPTMATDITFFLLRRNLFAAHITTKVNKT